MVNESGEHSNIQSALFLLGLLLSLSAMVFRARSSGFTLAVADIFVKEIMREKKDLMCNSHGFASFILFTKLEFDVQLLWVFRAAGQ